MAVTLYSDVNLFTPDKTPMATNLATIYQTIYALMVTKPGERLFRPTLGTNIEKLLFEPVNDVTAASLRRELIINIPYFEPRVSISGNQTFVDPYPDDHMYKVQVVFKVPSLSDEFFSYTGDLFREK
jgi:phage baseplate assembly protein W